MLGSFWSKAKEFLGGLSKRHGTSGLFHKAKSALSHGMDFLKSKPVKSIVDSISHHVPTARTYFDDAKKYGNIVSNMMNGGLEKKLDRFVKHNKPETTIERVPRQELARKPGMFDTGGLFGF